MIFCLKGYEMGQHKDKMTSHFDNTNNRQGPLPGGVSFKKKALTTLIVLKVRKGIHIGIKSQFDKM